MKSLWPEGKPREVWPKTLILFAAYQVYEY